MQFISHRPDRHRTPEAIAVGWAAMRVYELLIDISAHFDLQGEIPARYLHPEFLMSFWNMRDEDSCLRLIVDGLSRLDDVKLVKIGDDDGVSIVDWMRMYGPKTATGKERMKTWRQRHKEQAASQELQRHGSDVTGTVQYSTDTNNTVSTVTGKEKDVDDDNVHALVLPRKKLTEF